MFCKFMTTYAGKCGKWAKVGDLCDRHIGKKEKPIVEKGKRFRGFSKHQKEIGFWNTTTGKNV